MAQAVSAYSTRSPRNVLSVLFWPFLCTALLRTAHAQHRIAVQAGPSLTLLERIDGPDGLVLDEHLVTMATGALWSATLGGRFALRTGLLWERRGGAMEVLRSDERSLFTQRGWLKLYSDHLGLPVMLGYRSKGRVQVLGGWAWQRDPRWPCAT